MEKPNPPRMIEAYSKHNGVTDRSSVSRPARTGYLSSEPSELTSSHYIQGHHQYLGDSSDFLMKEYDPLRPTTLNAHDVVGVGVPPDPVTGVAETGAIGMKAYPPPREDPVLISQRGDASVPTTSGIPDVINNRPNSSRSGDCHSASRGESNILFVDGLPTDCTRREVGHLFRPFIGYKDIKVIHKEPRYTGDRATVMCFVEFVDVKCAATALEALQGYKFDDKKVDSAILKIHSAHFPFRLPSDHDGSKIGTRRIS